jgi:hypothetical protein
VGFLVLDVYNNTFVKSSSSRNTRMCVVRSSREPPGTDQRIGAIEFNMSLGDLASGKIPILWSSWACFVHRLDGECWC